MVVSQIASCMRQRMLRSPRSLAPGLSSIYSPYRVVPCGARLAHYRGLRSRYGFSSGAGREAIGSRMNQAHSTPTYTRWEQIESGPSPGELEERIKKLSREMSGEIWLLWCFMLAATVLKIYCNWDDVREYFSSLIDIPFPQNSLDEPLNDTTYPNTLAISSVGQFEALRRVPSALKGFKEEKGTITATIEELKRGQASSKTSEDNIDTLKDQPTTTHHKIIEHEVDGKKMRPRIFQKQDTSQKQDNMEKFRQDIQRVGANVSALAHSQHELRNHPASQKDYWKIKNEIWALRDEINHLDSAITLRIKR